MTYRQCETSREIRLWIRDVIVPATVGVVTLLQIPSVRDAAEHKIDEIKTKFKRN